MKRTLFNLSTVILSTVLLTTTSCKKEPIVVTADKTTAAIGEVITFSCIATDGQLKRTFVTWDFGDGYITANRSAAAEVYNNNNLVTVSHAFMAAGTYTVSAIFNKSSNPTKRNATSTYGSVTVTISSITPTFEVQNASGNTVSSIMVAQSLTFVNTTAVSDKAQADITYEWYDNGVLFSSEKNPAPLQMNTAGDRTFKLKIFQGVDSWILELYGIPTPGTETWSVPTVITVGGQSLSNAELQAMIGGKWKVASTASFSGAAYTNQSNPCNASATLPTYDLLFSTIYLNSSGTADWAIDAFPATSAGNIDELPGVTLTVKSATTIDITGIGAASGEFGSFNNELYSTAAVSGSSMTLTRVDNGQNGSSSCPFTDTYTVILTR